MWMISLGAGISWAAVCLLNNTNIRALSSETALLCWWPSLCGRWCSQSASCMLHSSVTSSTSSTSTPGLSTGEKTNNNTDVECFCVHADSHLTHGILVSGKLIMHYVSNSLLASEQFAQSNCDVVTDSD